MNTSRSCVPKLVGYDELGSRYPVTALNDAYEGSTCESTVKIGGNTSYARPFVEDGHFLLQRREQR